MKPLTQKQESFVMAYIETGNMAEAYKCAYSADGMGDNAVYVEASRLMSNPKISLRVKEIQDDIAEKTAWRKIDSINVLSSVARGDVDDVKPGDMVSAVKALNSMFGWDKKTVDHTSSDGSMSHPGYKIVDE